MATTHEGTGSSTGRRNLKKKTLHIMEASSAHTLTDAQVAADLDTYLAHEPDILGCTEMQDRMTVLRAAAKRHDYHLVQQPKVYEPFLVKVGENLKVRDRGRVLVVKGNGLPAQSPKAITTRYVSWVEVRFYDVNVFVHITHWMANQSTSHEAAVDVMKQSRVIATNVRKHAVGLRNFSFFMGDLNYDQDDAHALFADNNDPLHFFRNQGLQLVYDELGVTPSATHGRRAIDVIGTYRPDDRVKATRYKVYQERVNSDHRPMSAWYELEMRDKTDGDPHDPKPAFESGGNVNWGDYKDRTIYPLPYAVDDSDTTNG